MSAPLVDLTTGTNMVLQRLQTTNDCLFWKLPEDMACDTGLKYDAVRVLPYKYHYRSDGRVIINNNQ